MPKKKLPYNDRNGYAYVYVNRKPIPLKAPDGVRCKTGIPESLTAYHWYALELQNPMVHNISHTENITVEELCAGYAAVIKDRIHHTDFSHDKTVIMDFLSLQTIADSVDQSNTPLGTILVGFNKAPNRTTCINKGGISVT